MALIRTKVLRGKFDISVISKVVGPEISQALLFVHVCFSNSCLFDTVSQIHGKKIIQGDAVLAEGAKELCAYSQTHETIEGLGEKVLVSFWQVNLGNG